MVDMETKHVRIFRLLFAATFLLTAYLSVAQLPEMNDPRHLMDKVHHAVAFYALALLLDFALPHTEFGLRKFFALLAFGLAIECAQYFLPWRQASVLDLVADAVGLMLYVAGIPLLKRLPLLRRRWSAE